MAPRKKAVETSIVETETAEIKAAEAVVKEEAPKAKRTTTRKTAAKKPAKAPAKSTARTAAQPEASVVIQCAGKEIVAKDVLAAAAKAFQETHEGVEIKTIELYIKPEEGAAYYVVNGESADGYKVEL